MTETNCPAFYVVLQSEAISSKQGVSSRSKMGQDQEKRLGKYLIKARLGQGGMGVVYLATDTRLKRDVALKVLSKSLSSNPLAVKRFLLEARVAARVSHPNVVTIYDVDQQQGYCFLVMEYLTGGNGQDLVLQGPLSWMDATRMIADACRGLIAIHSAGLIHRDIKPSNIMRAGDGTVKLTDFGLAKVTASSRSMVSSPLTQSSTILGTPQFMSPEQCQGEDLDPRSDLYSLGATYFALLTGRAPFEDAQPLQVMFAHCSKPAPDPRSLRKEIPPACAQLVQQTMAKQRVDRFASAEEMLVALQSLLNASPNQALPPLPQLTGVEVVRSAPAPAPVTAIVHPITNIEETTVIDLGGEPPEGATRVLRLSEWKQKITSRTVVGVTVASFGLLLLSYLIRAGFGTSETGASGSTGGSSRVGDSHGTGQDTSRRSNPLKRPRDGQASNLATVSLTFEKSCDRFDSLISAAAFSPDGQSFYYGGMNGHVGRWSIVRDEALLEYSGTRQSVRAVASHGPWLVAGGDAKQLWVWNVDSGKLAQPEIPFRGEICSLAFSPDGRKLLVGSYAELRLYNVATNGLELQQELGTSTSGEVKCYMVASVAFSPDGALAAATSWDRKTVAVWQASDGTLRAAKFDQAEEPRGLAFLGGENRLVFGSTNEGIFLWDLETSQLQPVAGSIGSSGQRRSVRALEIPRGSSTLISVGEWGSPIRLYDLDFRNSPETAHQANSMGTSSMAISADQRKLLICGGTEDKQQSRGFVQIWNVKTEK